MKKHLNKSSWINSLFSIFLILAVMASCSNARVSAKRSVEQSQEVVAALGSLSLEINFPNESYFKSIVYQAQYEDYVPDISELSFTVTLTWTKNEAVLQRDILGSSLQDSDITITDLDSGFVDITLFAICITCDQMLYGGDILYAGIGGVDIIAGSNVNTTILLTEVETPTSLIEVGGETDPEDADDPGTLGIEIEFNNNPFITSVEISDDEIMVGDTVPVIITAEDPDGDTLTYRFSTQFCISIGRCVSSTLPDQVTGTFSWEPGVNATHTLSITVEDGRGGSADTEINVEVLPAAEGAEGEGEGEGEGEAEVPTELSACMSNQDSSFTPGEYAARLSWKRVSDYHNYIIEVFSGTYYDYYKVIDNHYKDWGHYWRYIERSYTPINNFRATDWDKGDGSVVYYKSLQANDYAFVYMDDVWFDDDSDYDLTIRVSAFYGLPYEAGTNWSEPLVIGKPSLLTDCQ